MAIETDPGEQIVITGMGGISPLGLDVDSSVERVMAGEAGIMNIREDGGLLEPYPKLRVHVGAPVEGFDPLADPLLADKLNDKELRKLHRSTQFALAAGLQAVRQAGLLLEHVGDDGELLDHDLLDADRFGVSVGTGIGGAELLGDVRARVDAGKRMPPSTILQVLPERSAAVLSMLLKARGPVKEVTGACATGNMNIIAAADMLRLGRADVVLAGGTEAQITIEALALFDGTTALDTSPDPRQASRPFHTGAKGFVMGEGAGMPVLEKLSHARRRGAVPLAALVGYGESADAFHETAPSGEGAERALRIALAGAGRIRDLRNVHVNAHATGTQGDAVELETLARVFEDPEQVAGISATKGATGHLLGAAGAFEAIMSIEAMRRGQAPPLLKLDPDESGARPVVEAAKPWRMGFDATLDMGDVDLAVNNAFGFGGLNAVTVFAPVRP